MKKCFAVVALAALVLAGLPPSGASADDEFFKLAGKRNWLSYADARPVSPYFGIPGELRPGVPVRPLLDRRLAGALRVLRRALLPRRGRGGGRAADDRAVREPHDGPDQQPRRGQRDEEGDRPASGCPGPTPSPRTRAARSASVRPSPASAPARASCWSTPASPGPTPPSTATRSSPTRLSPGWPASASAPIRIAALETRLKLEYILDAEPVISYSMTIAGARSGRRSRRRRWGTRASSLAGAAGRRPGPDRPVQHRGGQGGRRLQGAGLRRLHPDSSPRRSRRRPTAAST